MLRNRDYSRPVKAILHLTLALIIVGLTGCHSPRANHFKAEPGAMVLFNGTDLTGWGYKTNNFNGKVASDDKRYSAENGVLVVHPREPRLMQILWTTKEFPKNFTLKLEFRAQVNADSGIFIRK